MIKKQKDQKKFRSLGINAALNAIKSGLSIIFPLITYPYAFRILHADGIGRVNYAISIVGYFTLLAGLGIKTYAVREGSKIRDEDMLLAKYVNEVFTINVITTIVSYLLLFFVLTFSDKLRSYSTLVWLLSLSIGFTTLGIEWINAIFEDYLYITLRSIAINVITLVLLFIMVRSPNDYYNYALLTVISNGLICITNWNYCRKYVKISLTKKININNHIKPILIFFANSVATNIYVNADTTLLGWYVGDIYVGMYAIAAKIYNVIKTLIASIYTVAVPRISYYVGKKDVANIKIIYTQFVSNISLILFPVSAGMVALSKEIIILMGGYEYLDAIPSLQILSVSLIGAIFGGSINYCLNIPLGREKYNVRATIISAIINLILNIFLIPIYKHIGASITTTISEFFVFFYSIFVFKEFRKYLEIKIIITNIFQSLLGCFTIFIISYFVHLHFSNPFLIISIIFFLSLFFYFIELILLKNRMIMEIIEKIQINTTFSK